MRIALLAPAWFPVPPVLYGGIEWVVSILADGLVDRGHDVTLFAAGESQTKAHLRTSYDEPPTYRLGMALPDLHHALTCLEYSDEFDVWQPRFLDYMYVATTNQVAFSPTDTMPLTRTAKMLMVWQSVVAIATLGIVLANAINIFPNP